MEHGAALPGAASSVLVTDVRYLDPSPAVRGDAGGWSRQQRSRFLRADVTIKPRLEVVRRFARFSNQYPWQWIPGELEAFIVSMTVAVSTARSYQNSLRMFCDYITDARYGWPAECVTRFGVAPQQVLHEWNSVVHSTEYEGRSSRRSLSYDEVQALFDAADGRVEEIRQRRRKGAAAAQRDAVLLKTVYAFGLRRQEARGWTWSTYAATRRPRPTGGSEGSSCATGSPPAGARRSGAPSSRFRSSTGSSGCSSTTSPRSARCSAPGSTWRSG